VVQANDSSLLCLNAEIMLLMNFFNDQ